MSDQNIPHPPDSESVSAKAEGEVKVIAVTVRRAEPSDNEKQNSADTQKISVPTETTPSPTAGSVDTTATGIVDGQFDTPAESPHQSEAPAESPHQSEAPAESPHQSEAPAERQLNTQMNPLPIASPDSSSSATSISEIEHLPTGGKVKLSKWIAGAVAACILGAVVSAGIAYLTSPKNNDLSLADRISTTAQWTSKVATEVDGDAQAFAPYALALGDSKRLGIIVPKENGAILKSFDRKNGKYSNFYLDGKEQPVLALPACDKNLQTKQPYYYANGKIRCVSPGSDLDKKVPATNDDNQTASTADADTTGVTIWKDQLIQIVAKPNQEAAQKILAYSQGEKHSKLLWSENLPIASSVGSDGKGIWVITQGAEKDQPKISYYLPGK